VDAARFVVGAMHLLAHPWLWAWCSGQTLDIFGTLSAKSEFSQKLVK
jgi:hypothetical protein